MPVVTCPKCPTRLKVPDGARGNTKCPKCGTVFPVGQPAAAPAFEVVDESPAPAPKPAAKKAEADEPDFEVEEKPKKRVTADEDDDDAPRKKKKRDEDDDDDDDDDEDDRPRKKRKPEKSKKKKKRRAYDDDEDDDEDDWRPSSSPRAAFAKAKTGAQLMSIGFWLNMGAYGVLALYALIVWIMYLSATSGSSTSRSSRGGGGGMSGDGSFLDVVVMLPGLAGLGAWVVGLVGCSFAIAGPAKARGMAITATVFAALHLLFTGLTFSNMQDGAGLPVPGLRKIGWLAMASTLFSVDMFLPMLFYQSRAVQGDYLVAFLAGVCEIGRLIFMLLTLKALAEAARDRHTADQAQTGVVKVAAITGGAVLGVLLVFVLIYEAKSTSLAHLGFLTLILVFVGYTLMMLSPALAAINTRDACDSRS